MTGARHAFWSPSILRRLLTAVSAALLVWSAILSIPVAGAMPWRGSDDAPRAQSVSVPAARQAKNVAIITIEGAIDGDTALSVKRRMDESVRGGANAIVLDINSPGGEVGAVLEICTAIKRSPISNTVAWVHPDAYSGGAIIALACREIVISDAATMGDAAPIQVAFGMFLNQLEETERAKMLAPLLGEIVDSARLRGYDEKLVQGFVSLGVELWLVESLDRPGEILFIDRREFEMLFGTEPPAAAPSLVGPSPRPDDIAKVKPPAPSTEEMLKKMQRSLGPKRQKGSNGAPANRTGGGAPADDTTKFIPAAPGMSTRMGDDVSDRLETPSGRPVLSEKDRGKWRFVEYVSDGRSLYTLKQRQLLDYHLAARGQTTSGTVDNDEELKAFFGATNLARLNRTALEATASFLNHIVVKGLLIAIFLIGFFIELIHPGLIFPGSAAAVALVLLIAPALILGLGAWWQVGAILLGVILLAVEVFIIPGFGVFGVLGLLSLFGGLIGTFAIGGTLFPDSPGRGDMLYAIITLLISTATSIGVVYAVVKHIGSMPMLNRLVLQSPRGEGGSDLLAAMGEEDGPVAIGEEGVALSPLRPSGRAQFGDTIADVTSQAGYIAPGQTVRVIEASSFRVVVEPASGVAFEARPAPPGRPGGTA